MSELALATMGSRSRLSHAVARLEANGWVRRESVEDDRRGQVAIITEAGVTTLRDAAPGHVETVRETVFEALSPEQVEALYDVCAALARHSGGTYDRDSGRPYEASAAGSDGCMPGRHRLQRRTAPEWSVAHRGTEQRGDRGHDAHRTSATPSTPTPKPSPTPTADCLDRVLAAMSTREKAAQLVMTGIRAGGMSRGQRRTLAGQQPGGILLLGTSGDADDVRRVVAAAKSAAGRPNGVAPLVAADQEGGQVQRLQGAGFDRMPSATTQSGWSDAELTRKATRWADQLDAVGVHVDLAPVADVVPSSVGDRNEPIGALDRGYGSDPEQVGGTSPRSFAGCAARRRHRGQALPRAGPVRGNTDFSSGVVDRTTRRGDPLLAPFRAGSSPGPTW